MGKKKVPFLVTFTCNAGRKRVAQPLQCSRHGKACRFPLFQGAGLTTLLNMENVLATLPEKVSPAAVNQGANHAFTTGGTTYATSLVEQFTADAGVTTKLTLLKEMANNLTCEQFKDEAKKAQNIADTMDAAAGFKKPEGAKGQEAYGTVRQVLNSRLSEAKALFGVFKASPDTLKEKGYAPALKAARAYLKSQGIKWDGSTAPTDAQKDAKATKEALASVMETVAQEAGESLKDYLLRCEALVETELEQQADLKQAKAFEKLLKDVDQGALLAYMLDRMDIPSLESALLYADEQLTILKVSAAA